MTEIRGRHIETQQPMTVVVDGDRIVEINELACDAAEADALPLIAPGFFDLQVNGYNGIWFCSPDLTVNQVIQVTQALVDRGISQYFPTLITASFAALQHGFSTLRAAIETSELVADTVAGCHLEGPYISADDGPRGAHPTQHVRPADYDEFLRLQEASGNRIRLVTLAAQGQVA